MVFIHVVRTNLSVYWFSLAPVPKSILNKLRKMIFDFLWGSLGACKHYHLVDWKFLSRPIELGGWGIKNMEWFSISLRLKSLWLVLNGTGIWHKVITAKYLKNQTVEVWLRTKNFLVRGTLIFRNGFLNTLSWLGSSLG